LSLALHTSFETFVSLSAHSFHIERERGKTIKREREIERERERERDAKT
jgi:hypothetical protein